MSPDHDPVEHGWRELRLTACRRDITILYGHFDTAMSGFECVCMAALRPVLHIKLRITVGTVLCDHKMATFSCRRLHPVHGL